jgi:hypothetical protein
MCIGRLPAHVMPLQGNIIKVLLIYNDTWWEKEGLSGTASGNMRTLDFIADSTNWKPGCVAGW